MGPKCNRKYKSEAKGDLPHTEEKVLRRGTAVRLDDACLEDWRDAANERWQPLRAEEAKNAPSPGASREHGPA